MKAQPDQSGPQTDVVHEYAFDCTLTAAIRVKGVSRQVAEDVLRATLDSADCNGGAWPNGDPVLFEASVNDSALELYEIDGQPVGMRESPQTDPWSAEARRAINAMDVLQLIIALEEHTDYPRGYSEATTIGRMRADVHNAYTEGKVPLASLPMLENDKPRLAP